MKSGDFAIYDAHGTIVRRGRGTAVAATADLAPGEAVFWGQVDHRTHYLPSGIPTAKPDTRTISAEDVKQHAARLLSYTDWMVIRAAEGGAPVPAPVTVRRAAIRAASNRLETMNPIPLDFRADHYWTEAP